MSEAVRLAPNMLHFRRKVAVGSLQLILENPFTDFEEQACSIDHRNGQFEVGDIAD